MGGGDHRIQTMVTPARNPREQERPGYVRHLRLLPRGHGCGETWGAEPRATGGYLVTEVIPLPQGGGGQAIA